MRNSKCQHAVAELDGLGSKGALTVAYKVKMEYNMNPANHTKSITALCESIKLVISY